MAELLLIKSIARGLKYSSLDGLIGQTTNITSLATAENEVRKLLQRNLDGQFEVLPSKAKSLQGTIAKYGIIDATFDARNVVMAEFESGLPLMKRLNLLQDLPDDDEFAREIALDVLQGLVGEIERGKTLAKVFLRTNVSIYSVRERISFVTNGLPTDFFPRTFVVEDACVTNADSVWLNKHVYF